jgi:hypothetical protein
MSNEWIVSQLRAIKERIARNRAILDVRHPAWLPEDDPGQCPLCGDRFEHEGQKQREPWLCGNCELVDYRTGFIRQLAAEVLWSQEVREAVIDFLLSPRPHAGGTRALRVLTLARIGRLAVGYLDGMVFMIWPDGSTWSTEIKNDEIQPPGYWARP